MVEQEEIGNESGALSRNGHRLKYIFCVQVINFSQSRIREKAIPRVEVWQFQNVMILTQQGQKIAFDNPADLLGTCKLEL